MAKLVKPNHLIGEKSPYLLEHAYNPVDWYPWGDAAFAKARAEQKPIFLSIGYSTCHWCHVMAHESFENEKTAAIMNEKFVSIKVDREERPDLDDIYMKAVTSLTGQGGWPLSAFLTPELKPFYGGTYFPPVPRHGLPGFPEILNFVADAWTKKKEEIVKSSEDIMNSIKESYELSGERDLTKVLLDNAYAAVLSTHDPQFGGFGGAPKFPLPSYLGFLLRYHSRTGKASAMGPVTKTLDSMADGGIYDHLAGGFHRYSTDRHWLVPHFEKMLYDNALLARVYSDAYRVTKLERYASVARETLGWMLTEMSSPEGGFYSAQDADTPEGEGYYYTWTPAEVNKVLGKDDGAIFSQFYGVTPEGNFEEGRSILSRPLSLERFAEKVGMPPAKIEKVIEKGRKALLDARKERSRPAIDDKILASWNGLAISALSTAYQALQDETYLVAARRTADFMLSKLVTKGRRPSLYRRYRDGEVAIPGNLEDYSFLIAGLLDLYESSLEARYLSSASSLAEEMVAMFWDAENGAFFLKPPKGELVPIKEGYDGPTPSGNSVAAMDLLRLSELTGDDDKREMAENTLRLFADSMESSPSAHLEMLGAVDFSFGSREIVVAGEKGQLGEVLREIQTRYIPAKVLALADGNPATRKLTEGKTSIKGLPTVYICEDFACKPPVTSIKAMTALLDAAPSGAGG